MTSIFRFSPSRLAVAYIALSVLALALFAIPLWYAWSVNVSTFRAYVHGEDMQRLVDVFSKEGAKGLAAAIDSKIGTLPGDEVILLADASKARLAGNLPRWPTEVPDAPGAYGLVIDLGGGSSMRVVVSHARLPGGYHFLMGRESVRFQSLVELFWYGIAGAMAIVVVLGAIVGWRYARAPRRGGQTAALLRHRRRRLTAAGKARRIGRARHPAQRSQQLEICPAKRAIGGEVAVRRQPRRRSIARKRPEGRSRTNRHWRGERVHEGKSGARMIAPAAATRDVGCVVPPSRRHPSAFCVPSCCGPNGGRMLHGQGRASGELVAQSTAGP